MKWVRNYFLLGDADTLQTDLLNLFGFSYDPALFIYLSPETLYLNTPT